MSDNDHLLDSDRSACLCDVGLESYIAATAVAADGAEHLVLVLRDAIGDPAVVYDANCPAVEHESTGKLSGEWRERIWGELARCGRPTAAGQPCRRIVGTPGESCTQHRGQPKVAARPPRRRFPRAVCPVCGKNVAVAPKRGTFGPHGDYHGFDDQGYETWSLCPMSGQPAEVSS
jgi:hypothetical protein